MKKITLLFIVSILSCFLLSSASAEALFSAENSLSTGSETVVPRILVLPWKSGKFSVIRLKNRAASSPLITASVTPKTVVSGSTAVLTWQSKKADNVSINNGVGKVELSGSVSVQPTETTTYTIIVTGAGGTVSKNITVEVIGIDSIHQPSVSLEAHPTSISSGDSATLKWTSMNADSVSLDNGIGTIDLSSSLSQSDFVHAQSTITTTNTSPTDPVSITVDSGSTLNWSNIWSNTNTNTSDTTDFVNTSSGISGNINVSITSKVSSVISSGTITVTPSVTTTYTITAEGPGGTATDTATIEVTGSGSTPAPTVSLSADPVSITVGNSSTLSWSSTNAETVSINNGIGTVAANGTQIILPTATTTYTITATGAGGTTTDTVTVEVSEPIPAPTVTLTADPTSITAGNSSTLSWSSTSADSVSIDNGIGPVATNGTQIVSPTATTTYTITATGAGGTATESVTITVHPLPTVSLSADPTSITAGGSSTLTWTSTNADTVSIDNGIGTVTTSGAQSVSPSATTTYIITATGTGVTVTESVTITVLPLPTVSLTADPTSITAGGSSTLTWTSSNAETVSIDNGIGSVSTSGTTTVTPSATTTYTITATGAGGTVTEIITVTVPPKKSEIFTDYGVAVKSIYLASGFFTKNDKGDKVYYGGTRSGEFCRLFRYNLSTNSVDLVVPIEEAKGAWGITFKDNMVYIGTYLPASLYKYDIEKENLTKISTFKNSKYVHQVDIYEGNIFIATYPTSSVFMYNIQSGEMLNLGPMSEHKYSRSLEFYDKKMYVGIGANAQLIEYDLEKGDKKNILPPEFKNESFVYYLERIGTKLFATLSPSPDILVYDLVSKEFILHAKGIRKEPGIEPTFTDDKVHFTGGRTVFEYDEKLNTLHRLIQDKGLIGAHIVDDNFIAGVTMNAEYMEILFNGQMNTSIDLTNIGLERTKIVPMSITANDNKVFIAERQLRIVDIESGTEVYKILPGEAKSMCFVENSLITATYPGAKVWKYPISAFEEPNSDFTNHEQFSLFHIGYEQNRPKKIIANKSNNSILIGTEPNYGQYGGALIYYNFDTQQRYTNRNIIHNHTIEAITLDESNPNIAYIGSSVYGGTGADPLDEDAHIVKWDIQNQSVLFDIIPQVKNKRIRSLSHSNDKLYATTQRDDLYMIDSITGEILLSNTSSKVRSTLYSVDGNLYGIYYKKFFTIDKSTLKFSYYNHKAQYFNFLVEDKMKNKIFLVDGYNLWSFE